IWHGLSLYAWNLDWHPNTYGPVTYLAYLPFERIWPNNGQWNDLPAAHAASIAFDLLTVWGMYVLGRNLRPGRAGRELGTILAFTSDVGLHKFWNETIGYQADRPSPFSIWGLHTSLMPLRRVVEVAMVVLAVGVAAFPRRRTAVQVAALAAAILLAVEISASHWFYLYIVWFTPPLLAAVLGEYGISSWRMPVDLPASSASTITALSHGSPSA